MAGGIRAGFLLFGTPVASAPTGAGIAGVDRVWIKSSNDHLIHTDAANVDHDLTAGGGGGSSTLATAYTTGANQTDSTVLLDATRLGVRVRDNGTPITGALFSVQNSAGTSKFVDITAAATQLLASGMADGAAAIGLTTNTLTSFVNATAKLVSVQNNASEKLFIDANGFLIPGAGQASTAVHAPVWIAPTLLNSWVSYGAPYANPGYYRDALGIVHIQGLVKNSPAVTNVIFNLPAGYRPAATTFLPVYSGGSMVMLQADTSGNVVVNAGSTASVSLYASFPAEL